VYQRGEYSLLVGRMVVGVGVEVEVGVSGFENELEKKNELGRACSMHRRDKKFTHFDQKM
jgi:hypothetical protein